MIDKQTLVESVDLVDLITRMTGKTPHKAGAEWRMACPIHGGTNLGGFAIFMGKDRKQRWTCFTSSCGTGDALDFVKAYMNVDFVKACEYLGGKDVDPAEIRALAQVRAAAAAEELKLAQERMARALEDLKCSKCWEDYHNNLDKFNKRGLWEQRGIPRDLQEFWQLGYDPEFKLWKKNEETGIFEAFWTTPTLSIPVFGLNWELNTVRHRLLNPPEDSSKYRPERADLGAFPFIADPDNCGGGEVLFVEGEIKAGVTWKVAERTDLQVIGIPGKKSLECITPYIGLWDRAYVCLDPDADAKAVELAKMLGAKARMMRIGMKIDDAMNEGYLDKRGLQSLMNTAVKPEYFL